MDISSRIEDGDCNITVSGALTFHDNKEWRRVCQAAVAEDGAERCILDLCGLENIDSAGLGMILALRTWVEREGKTLRLRYRGDNFVGSMMRLVKFDAMLLVEET